MIGHPISTGGTQRLSGPELVRHPDKLRQGLGLHLFHDLAAIHFDGRFAGSEFRCNLLVKHPRDDEVHYLALANAESFTTMSQFSYLSLVLAQDAISSERSLDRIEEILMSEWLGKKLNGPGLHGLDRHRNVSVSREKNNGNTYSPSFQFVLKIQAADTRKSHIQN